MAAEQDFVARFKTDGEGRFIGNFRKVGSAAESAGEHVEDSGRKARRASRGFASLSTSMSGTGRTALRAGAGMRVGLGSALALAGGFIGVGTAVRSMSSEYQESVKTTAATNAVLKSTDHIAGITARHVDKLSNSLSRKIGKDDEEIAATENLLLRFTKLRNEVGKGNKIFDRATLAAEDLAAALGRNTRSTALLVGRALQDPVKGLTALTRAGVTFSDKQKKVITRLVETGDRLKAQKMILRELETRVKGSAAAQATPIDRLKVSWGNLAESMGKLGAPVAIKGIKFLTGFLDRLQSGGGIEGRVNKIAGTVKRLVRLVAGTDKAPRVKRAPNAPERTAPGPPNLSTWESFAKRSGEIFRTVKGAALSAGRTLIDAFKPAMPFLQNVLLPLAIGVGKGIVGAFVVGFRLLTPVLRVAAGAIKVVATVLGWVGKQARPLRGWIDKLGIALGIVSKGPMLVIGAVARAGASALSFFGKAAQGAWRKLNEFIRGVKGVGPNIVRWISDGIREAPGALLDALKSVLSSAVGSLPGGIGRSAKKLLGLDGMAKGGRARYTGPHVVGEKGMEIVNLNRGDNVTPNARLGRAVAPLAGGAAFLTVPIVVELDGHQVGRGMGRIALQDMARA